MVPVKACWKYFPEKKGSISGVILFGSGISTAIFNPIATMIINPEGIHPVANEKGEKYYNEEISRRVINYITISSMIFLCLGIIATILISEPPVDLQPINMKSSEAKEMDNIKNTSNIKKYIIKFTLVKQLKT